MLLELFFNIFNYPELTLIILTEGADPQLTKVMHDHRIMRILRKQ